jgi:hypothetical protein
MSKMEKMWGTGLILEIYSRIQGRLGREQWWSELGLGGNLLNLVRYGMNVTMKAFHVHVRGNQRLQEEEIEEQSAGNDMAWTCARGNGTWQSIFV